MVFYRSTNVSFPPIADIAPCATLIEMGHHTISEVFAPLVGAAVFAAMVGWGFVSGKMPSKYGPDADKNELPTAFWTVGAIYAAGCVACLIWFVVTLLT